MSNSSIWPIDRTLSDASGPRRDSNEGVLRLHRERMDCYQQIVREVAALTPRITILTGQGSQLVSSWQTKLNRAVTRNRPHAFTKISNKLVHIYTNMYIPGPATKHYQGNGLNHMCAMECSSDHKIPHSSEFRLASNITECWLYVNQDSTIQHGHEDRIWNCAGITHWISNPIKWKSDFW